MILEKFEMQKLTEFTHQSRWREFAYTPYLLNATIPLRSHNDYHSRGYKQRRMSGAFPPEAQKIGFSSKIIGLPLQKVVGPCLNHTPTSATITLSPRND